MSANNQTLIVQHKDKYYVFENVNAEAWDEGEAMELDEKDASVYDNKIDAILKANELEDEDPTEYGIVEDRLWKDDCPVKIKESRKVL